MTNHIQNILIILILLTSTNVSYAFMVLASAMDCSEYTYGIGTKDELTRFLHNLKQLARQYECNNAELQATEAMAVCTNCSPEGFFTEIVNWITPQQDNIFPCTHTNTELLREHFSKIVDFPLRLFSINGRVKSISSLEEFYDELPYIFNADILESIQNAESIYCSSNLMAHIEDTLFIRKDENQQLKIFMIR